jgi:hypothetical protein
LDWNDICKTVAGHLLELDVLPGLQIFVSPEKVLKLLRAGRVQSQQNPLHLS